MNTNPRLDRLPQWAQAEISGLRRRVDLLTAIVENAVDGTPMVMMRDLDLNRPMPDSEYRFRVDPPYVDQLKGRLDHSEGWIDVERCDGGISIKGRHALEIHPRSANSVIIQLRYG